MICDKCVKKSVCKLCDGSNIQGCIEFYRPHEKVLQEVRQEMAESKYNHRGEYNRELAFNICLQIIDNKVKQIEESGAE